MAAGWLGYDLTRVGRLERLTSAAVDELAAVQSDDPAAVAAVATVTSIAQRLRTHSLTALRTIGVDTSLTAWSTAGLGSGAAHTRDQRNRRQLATDLERLTAAESADDLSDEDAAILTNARAVATALAEGAEYRDPRTGEPVAVQLYLYEPAAHGGDGRAAVALGNLDTAAHVAVIVPGMGTEVARLRTSTQSAVFTATSEHTADGIAVMTWVGYDAPSIAVSDGSDDNPVDDVADWAVEAGDLAEVLTIRAATAGAALLASDISGLRAARPSPFHLTVIGNSYGSTTVAIAADEFVLEADDAILTGSPGAGRADDAGDLTTGHARTWVGSASDDPVSYLGRTGGAEPHDIVDVLTGGVVVGPEIGLGNDPAEDDFGARRFQAEWPGRDDSLPWALDGHGQYFSPCSESAGNVGAIVAGAFDAVTVAEHRHKDESWDLGEPLGDLLAVDPEADAPVDIAPTVCSAR
jgi:hypothetical protein